MFESRTLKLLQAENAAMRAQVSDLHARNMEIYRQWSEERKDLISRIMALTQPQAVREMARATGAPATRMPSAATRQDPVQRNWPVGVPDTRPNISPELKEKMLATATSIEEATDLERGEANG